MWVGNGALFLFLAPHVNVTKRGTATKAEMSPFRAGRGRVPRKARVAREAEAGARDAAQRRRNDPLVTVRHDRLRAALEWRGVSHRDAASAVRAALQAAADDEHTRKRVASTLFSPQLLDRLVSGAHDRCRRSVVRALAKVLRRPITAKYLTGEGELDLPPLRFPPSGAPHLSTHQLPVDANGFLFGRGPVPPRYELEALSLGDAVKQAHYDPPDAVPDAALVDLQNVFRFVLALRTWQEVFYAGNGPGFVPDTGGDTTGADEFASHLAAAFRIFLKPCLRELGAAGAARLRPNTLARLGHALDLLFNESMRRSEWRRTGRLAELAAADCLQGAAPSGRLALAEHLQRFIADERACGRSEAEIVRALTHWQEWDEGVSE